MFTAISAVGAGPAGNGSAWGVRTARPREEAGKARYTNGMRNVTASLDPDTADDFTDDPDADSSWM
jgi:hypothetical protein